MALFAKCLFFPEKLENLRKESKSTVKYQLLEGKKTSNLGKLYVIQSSSLFHQLRDFSRDFRRIINLGKSGVKSKCHQVDHF